MPRKVIDPTETSEVIADAAEIADPLLAAATDLTAGPELADSEFSPGIADALNDIVLPPPTAGRPVVAPSGGQLAIIQPDSSGALRIWLAPLDGGEASVLDIDLEVVADPDGPQWSPDETQLAISAPHPADGRPAIWVITIATQLARVIVEHNARDTLPKWSPNGEWIAFLSQRYERVSASTVRSDGLSTSIQVSHAARGLNDHSLTWSRDSNRLAFAREAIDGDKTGDHIFTFDLTSGATKQVTTRLCGRRSLTWAPDRNLIMHVADDSEWDQIAVVNADNSSGWNIAAEKGDKFDPRWSADGQRVTYLRRHEGVVRVAERGTSTATAEVIDPGAGVGSAPQFLPDKRVLYVHESPAAGPQIFVQEPRADAERTTLPVIPIWASGRNLATPGYQEFDLNGIHTGALVYRRIEQEGDIPAVIVLRDRPVDPRDMYNDALEQALASTGMVIYVPTLPGTPGEGRKLSGALADRRDTEAEIMDLLALVDAISAIGGIDSKRIAIVGHGHGGALAMILAGGRPGAVHAVAAIDPVCDWNAEFDHTDQRMRDWLVGNLGLPATSQGTYSVRTPTTFAGVIDIPLLLMGTDTAALGRSAQLDALTTLLRELDHEFVQDVSLAEPAWTAMRRVAAFIRESLVASGQSAEAIGDAVTADAV